MFSLNAEALLPYLTRLMVVFLIGPLHEFAHAWTAYKLGDNTAKDMGRLTLSPLAHLDGFGSLLILLVGFGWAKPVPVKPSNFKNPSFGMMVTAVAGPFVNLVAALIGVIIFQLCGGERYVYLPVSYLFGETSSMGYAMWMLSEFISINIMLCLFNMLPVPPLDGSRVLTFLLPPRASVWLMRNQRIFYGIVMVLMITGLLSIPLSYANIYLTLGLQYITNWIPAVIG